jgi:FkbM family methyltransferase
MNMSSLRHKLRTVRSHPLIAVDYVLYCVGVNSTATAFGGRIQGRSYSEFRSARNLALSEQEVGLIETLPEQGDIFDVGANIGIWTVPLALGRPRSRIHAFEGSPFTVCQLEQNVVRNKLSNVRAVHAAVCDYNGKVMFQMPENASVFDRISSTNNSQGRYDRASQIEVPCMALADYCNDQDIKVIELLKIDVEGAEVDVLRGLLPMLLQHKVRLIWMEIDELNLRDFNHSISELATLMENCGYGFNHLSNLNRPVDIRVERAGNMLAKPL